jgi:hypothetical protein
MPRCRRDNSAPNSSACLNGEIARRAIVGRLCHPQRHHAAAQIRKPCTSFVAVDESGSWPMAEMPAAGRHGRLLGCCRRYMPIRHWRKSHKPRYVKSSLGLAGVGRSEGDVRLRRRRMCRPLTYRNSPISSQGHDPVRPCDGRGQLRMQPSLVLAKQSHRGASALGKRAARRPWIASPAGSQRRHCEARTAEAIQTCARRDRIQISNTPNEVLAKQSHRGTRAGSRGKTHPPAAGSAALISLPAAPPPSWPPPAASCKSPPRASAPPRPRPD